MRFFSKASRVLTDHEMLGMYARWKGAQMLGQRPNLDLDGVKLEGFPNFSSYWGAWWGRPSPGELCFVRRVMRQAVEAIDIGGNFGAFSVLMSKTNPSARIHSFEPVPPTYAALARNLERNGCPNVSAINAAVADQDGDMRITTTSHPATNRLIDPSDHNTCGVTVNAVSLDNFCCTNKIREIGLLKIDVEGAEPLVLAGAKELLARKAIHTILIEICPANLKNFQFCADDLADHLESAGYRIFAISPIGGLGKVQSRRDLATASSCNVIAQVDAD